MDDLQFKSPPDLEERKQVEEQSDGVKMETSTSLTNLDDSSINWMLRIASIAQV